MDLSYSRSVICFGKAAARRLWLFASVLSILDSVETVLKQKYTRRDLALVSFGIEGASLIYCHLT